ncbi:hypothetical protein ACLOAV_001439 [Pseudogymnoascus australis]
MATRAAARREAEFLAQSVDEKPVLDEQSIVPPVAKKKRASATKKTTSVSTQVVTDSKVIPKSELDKELAEPLLPRGEDNALLSANVPTSLKKGAQDKPNGFNGTVLKTPAKRASRKRKVGVVSGVPVKGGRDELPHNLGTATHKATESQPLPITPPGSVPHKKARTSRAKKTASSVATFKDEEIVAPDNEEIRVDSLGNTGQEDAQNKPKGRRRAPKKKVEDTKVLIETKTAVIEQNELANGFKPEDIEDKKIAPKRKRKAGATKTETSAKRFKLLEAGSPNDADFEDQKPKKTRARRVAKKVGSSQDEQDEVDKLIEENEILQKAKKPRKHKYGLTPGVTPFPDFVMPTAEACLEVKNLLSELHGTYEPPEAIPPPSLEVAGCGEVPCVLDALIRTRLSAATSGTNSGYAFTGLVSKFGILEEGIGKGSVNWSKVRKADVKDVEDAIKRGGLARTKSKDIKAILDMVREENIARREAFVKEKEGGEKADVVGGESLMQGQKDLEIATADKEILSLQYIHGLTNDEAMDELIKYPGIGVKTAACVILFNLRRPSFAVDTHVHRLTRWLKWIPDNANENKAFSHCEVRIPNEYKYSLHQLFFQHGQKCGRCMASTSETSEAWKETVCPIDHLVERTGLRKILKPASKIKKKKSVGEEDSDSELSELDDELLEGYEGNDTETTPEVEEEK